MCEFSLSFWSCHFLGHFLSFPVSVHPVYGKFCNEPLRQRVTGSHSADNSWSPLENALVFFPVELVSRWPVFIPVHSYNTSILKVPSQQLSCVYKGYRITPIKTNDHHHLNCNLIWTFFICYETLVELIWTTVSSWHADIAQDAEKWLFLSVLPWPQLCWCTSFVHVSPLTALGYTR